MGTLLAEPAGGAGALLLIGSYTHDDVLPHFPLARPQWGVGITLASFVDGRIVPLGVVPVLNPAFQKCVVVAVGWFHWRRSHPCARARVTPPSRSEGFVFLFRRGENTPCRFLPPSQR